MPDVWDRYRQMVRGEHDERQARIPVQAKERPVDPEVRAAAAVLMARFQALGPRMRGGGNGDSALFGEIEQLLRDHEELRDRRCPPGTGDWEDVQFRCGNLMVSLARVAAAQGRPGQASQWFTRAARAWLVLGDHAWAQECLAEAAEASLADGHDPDVIVETLDSWLGTNAPVRKSKLLSSVARALIDVGDLAGAAQRVSEAARVLDAAGFTDPDSAGSVKAALATWMSVGDGERMSGLPWLQATARLNAVAITWARLTQMRFRLGTVPLAQATALADELFAVAHRLISEAEDISREVTSRQDKGTASAASPSAGDDQAKTQAGGLSYEENINRGHELLNVRAQARPAGAAQAEADQLLAPIAELESRAAQAGDTLTASYAAIERADTLLGARRPEEAAAALEAARTRLGDDDGLDTARRRTLLVQIFRRTAAAAQMLKQFARLSEVCGEGIAESEKDRGNVNEPYLRDSYMRDRAMLYELGVLAAWELGEHELAVIRADLAKARGALGWAIRDDGADGNSAAAEIAGLRSQWALVADGKDAESDIIARRAAWRRIMGARARSRPVTPPALSLAALQAALDPDEAVIYYSFVARETLLIYTITPTGIAAERRDLGGIRGQLDELADDIEALRGEMEWLNRDIPSLGAHLLPRDSAGLLGTAQRLLICPHRILHHIPLHALNWREEPLIERFAVSYVPNVTSLLLSRPAPSSTAVLSVGIDSFPPPLPGLPGAEREASDICAIYEQQGRHVTALLGERATRACLQQLMADGDLQRFAVLHLVTHGEDHPPQEPNEAALHLADAAIDAMDVSQWTLTADLVALSACWSGRRPAHGHLAGNGSADPVPAALREELFGDEVYGLQAAFFAAGARQVLGTMWPLDNETGPALMKAFHAGLSCSQQPEVALQAAMRQQLRAGWPVYHWAPCKLTTLGRPSAHTAAALDREA